MQKGSNSAQDKNFHLWIVDGGGGWPFIDVLCSFYTIMIFQLDGIRMCIIRASVLYRYRYQLFDQTKCRYDSVLKNLKYGIRLTRHDVRKKTFSFIKAFDMYRYRYSMSKSGSYQI
jgi:hypothetical protein